jgi:hypothetical protein
LFKLILNGDNIFASNITYNLCLCSENLGLGCILTFFFLLEFIVFTSWAGVLLEYAFNYDAAQMLL